MLLSLSLAYYLFREKETCRFDIHVLCPRNWWSKHLYNLFLIDYLIQHSSLPVFCTITVHSLSYSFRNICDSSLLSYSCDVFHHHHANAIFSCLQCQRQFTFKPCMLPFSTFFIVNHLQRMYQHRWSLSRSDQGHFLDINV